MKGEEGLIRMRKRGLAPACVHVETACDPQRIWRDWASFEMAPNLYIEPDENVSLLDLRCLVGLTVLVHGTDEGRVDSVIAACMDAKAKRVIATVTKETGIDRVDCVRLTDTEPWLN